MGFLHHPLVQSLLVPALLAFLGAGVVRAALGPERGARWAAVALGLGVVVAAVMLLGWRWPPGAVLEKLVPVFIAAWGVGAGLQGAPAVRWYQWLVATMLWLAVSWWLGWNGVAMAVAAALLGTAVLAALSSQAPDNASGAAMSAVASLGLAGAALAGGSLVLFQVSLLLAAALGGIALWVWPKARLRFGPVAMVVAGIAWLVLAQAVSLLTPVPKGALLLLAAAFAAGPIASRVRLPGRRAVTEPLLAAAIAAVFAGGAAAWVALAHTPPAGAPADDPYYQPRWK